MGGWEWSGLGYWHIHISVLVFFLNHALKIMGCHALSKEHICAHHNTHQMFMCFTVHYCIVVYIKVWILMKEYNFVALVSKKAEDIDVKGSNWWIRKIHYTKCVIKHRSLLIWSHIALCIILQLVTLLLTKGLEIGLILVTILLWFLYLIFTQHWTSVLCCYIPWLFIFYIIFKTESSICWYAYHENMKTIQQGFLPPHLSFRGCLVHSSNNHTMLIDASVYCKTKYQINTKQTAAYVLAIMLSMNGRKRWGTT